MLVTLVPRLASVRSIAVMQALRSIALALRPCVPLIGTVRRQHLYHLRMHWARWRACAIRSVQQPQCGSCLSHLLPRMRLRNCRALLLTSPVLRRQMICITAADASTHDTRAAAPC
jgi:hypothetical protein